jgi:hypothetical protein
VIREPLNTLDIGRCCPLGPRPFRFSEIAFPDSWVGRGYVAGLHYKHKRHIQSRSDSQKPVRETSERPAKSELAVAVGDGTYIACWQH